MAGLLLGIEALDFLKEKSFPVLRSVLCTSVEEAIGAARAIGFPVVSKVSCRSVVHKTEVGGVVKDVADGEGLRKAYQDLLSAFMEKVGSKGLEGIIVQETGSGLEFSVGVYRDQLFGHVIMVGCGGV